jgi:DNA-binding transcriptional LysR family regulator
MLDLNALLIFAEVVEAGSFAGASRKLEQPTTNVSRKVQQLEKSLNARLLNRNTRSLSLTDTGEQVYKKAKLLHVAANEIRQLAAAHQEAPHGRLRVTAPTSFVNGIFGDWLIEFRLNHPQVSIDLLSSNAVLDFQEHKLDFAIRAGAMTDSSLIAYRIMSGTFGLFASPQLIAGRYEIRNVDALDLFPCLATTFDGHALPWMLRKGDQKVAYQPNGTMRAEDNDLLHRAAVSGVGIAYLPVAVVKGDLESGRLVPILQDLWAPPIDVYLVFPSKDHLDAKNRSFIQFILMKCASYKESGSLSRISCGL